MAGETRDWDKEMAAIDQVIAKGGYVAPSGAPAAHSAGGGAPAAATAVAAPARPQGGLHHFFAVWGRTLLGLGLAIGLANWPWVHHCGAWLYFYLSAVLILALAGLWIMRVSWVRRVGLSHVLGLLILGYAVWLGSAEILPRVGYANAAATWSCPAP